MEAQKSKYPEIDGPVTILLIIITGSFKSHNINTIVMEQDIIDPHPDYFIYKKSHIQLATFFGGPLAIIYILAENFRQLGYPEKVRKTWIIGLISCVLFFGLILLLQTSYKTPSLLPSLICILIGSAVMQSWQGDDIKLHIEQGGPVYPVWRALLIGVISLVLSVVFLIVLIIILQSAFGIQFAKATP
jgi:hypothetical protein